VHATKVKPSRSSLKEIWFASMRVNARQPRTVPNGSSDSPADTAGSGLILLNEEKMTKVFTGCADFYHMPPGGAAKRAIPSYVTD